MRINYHEHAFQVSPLLKGDELDNVENSIREFQDLLESGFEGYVEATPLFLGRNLIGLSRLIEQTKLNIFPVTGFHHSGHYSEKLQNDVTDKGTKTLSEKPAKTAELKVVYRYGLSFKFKGQPIIIPTSREWCREISAESESGKRWTSEDIFSLTPAEKDINPWTQRGGWYGNLPQCRHSWIQELRTTITQ